MAVLPSHKLTVDEYLAWAEVQEGRYELYAGTVHAMTPERVSHAKVKFAVQTALAASNKRNGVRCHMLPDGMTVRIDRETAHEPDALVYCGAELLGTAIEVPNPVIVVEVLSPTTRHIDAAVKLASYFKVASIQHYIIVDVERRIAIHHRRDGRDAIATRIVGDGMLRLDPPGLDLSFDEIFQG